jgi:hypothetical protein
MIPAARAAGAWTHDRVGYAYLTRQERDAIESWLRTHRVDPARTPIAPLIELDPSMGEWRIEQFWLNASGHACVDETGQDVRRVIVRRRARRPLPWPTWGERCDRLLAATARLDGG